MLTATLACVALTSGTALAFDHPFIGQFKTITSIGSTVPANGDVNPYGIVTVPQSEGTLVRGDTLISNFNNEENLQGTGTTIVQISPTGSLSLFAKINPSKLPGPCPGGVGLTTALALLPGGFVVVGSLPTSNGQAATAQAGCLIVLDSSGHVVQTISGPPINGPWDMTSVSQGDDATLFVTNVLNGTVASGETPTNGGTVVRIRVHIGDHMGDHSENHFGDHMRHGLRVTSMETIAEGFPERTDPAALVIGPTGVGLGEEGTLYVADTQGNRIAAVPGALYRQTPLSEGGITVATGGYLNNPLGLTITPNGDILTANANDGNLVETTPIGAEFQPLDTGAGGGGLFGLTIAPHNQGVLFVNDSNNTLDLLH
ncbi:MAG TPA: hypothetical protein VNY52_09275 [Solirubrobacteraceae bacterium]|nr:hypothetical protein [Solirubrobacteraceae bacterium]